jgi:hypothetical protein
MLKKRQLNVIFSSILKIKKIDFFQKRIIDFKTQPDSLKLESIPAEFVLQ